MNYQKLKKNGLITLILISLISCATTQSGEAHKPVYLSSQARYRLLPPEDIEAPLDMVQHIRGRYGDQELVLDAWVSADETGVTMAFFNSLGVGMGDLSFNRTGITFTSSLLPSTHPEYIIADFQCCFYRTEALAAALKRIGLSLTVERGPAGETRTIFEGSRPLITIEKTASAVRYTNYLRGYAYTLEGSF